MMLGCVLLAVELVLVFVMPPVGIPLLLITLAVMFIVGIARSGASVARGVANATAPRAESAQVPPDLVCSSCSQPIRPAEAALWARGAPYHEACWGSATPTA